MKLLITCYKKKYQRSCLQLCTIDISQNKFNGTVPTLLGQLSNIEKILFNKSEIRGSIPTEVFSLTQIKILQMQSNQLTGSFPTLMGTLQNLNQFIFSHKIFLKGNILLEFSNFNKCKALHLHDNQLKGTVPSINDAKKVRKSFITDCGSPNYAQHNTLKCKSCTVCCNSEGKCYGLKSNIWSKALPVLIGAEGLIIPSLFIIKKHICKRQINLEDIYIKSYVYSSIFPECITPKIIYFLTILLQFALFSAYTLATNTNNKNTDWN